MYEDIYEACSNAKLLLVLNNHKKYASLLYDEVLNYSEKGFEILDSWNVCTELHFCNNVKISTLGNMFI